jgi:hypothetical protein
MEGCLKKLKGLKGEGEQISMLLASWQQNLTELEVCLTRALAAKSPQPSPQIEQKRDSSPDKEPLFANRRRSIHETLDFFEKEKDKCEDDDEKLPIEQVIEALTAFEITSAYKWKEELEVQDVPITYRDRFSTCPAIRLTWNEWRERVHEGWPGSIYEDPVSPTFRNHVTLTLRFT